MFKKEARCPLSRAEIEQKANETLKQMTLKEKVWLLNGNWNMVTNQIRYKNAYNPTPIATNGVKRLGVSPIKFTDGPRGVVMGKSTCFPVSMARGASFDRTLEARIGDVIGKEARAQGANFFGGVCVNLLRHPAWGRAQETYGEDPFLVGEMGKELAEGVQEHNVMACVKHYAFNNIENSRFFVDVQADDRTMHEVYLAHFKKIVQAGAASVMGSSISPFPWPDCSAPSAAAKSAVCTGGEVGRLCQEGRVTAIARGSSPCARCSCESPCSPSYSHWSVPWLSG